MDLISQEELAALTERRQGPCVSLFMPAHRAVAEPKEDPLRFKNLLAAAGERLEEEGVRAPEAKAMLEPAAGLVKDGIFWKNQGDGLAMFAGRGLFKLYLLSYPVKESVVVGERFSLRPLLPLLSAGGHFFVLALSAKDVRLLRGTRFQVVEVDTSGLPGSLEETLAYRAPERQLQYHTGTPQRKGGRGERAAIFHGHGGGREDRKGDLLKYFREVDRAVLKALEGERAPLVLACVEYLIPIYREASNYQNLVEGGVPGNPDDLSAAELHERAWQVVEPWFDLERNLAAEQFRNTVGSGRATTDIGEIMRAVTGGGVETLFVDSSSRVWGAYEPSTGTAETHPERQPGDEDLLDLAAARCFLTGGKVYPVTAGEMPADSPAAAVLRY